MVRATSCSFKLLLGLALALVGAGVAMGQSPKPPGDNPFRDLPPDHWAYEDVKKLVKEGVMEGYPDGMFKGRKVITRYDMAKIVGKLLDRVNQMQKAGQALTPEETLSVTRLTNEFRSELDLLGVRVDALERRVDKAEKKASSLEQSLSNIRVEGFYRLENTFVLHPFDFTNYPFDVSKNPFTQFALPLTPAGVLVIAPGSPASSTQIAQLQLPVGLQPLSQQASLRFTGSPFLGGQLFRNVETFVELRATILGPSGGQPSLQYKFSNPPVPGTNVNDIATNVVDDQRVQIDKAHFQLHSKLFNMRAFSNESIVDLKDPAVLLTGDSFDTPPFSGLEFNGAIDKFSYFSSVLKVITLSPSPFPNGNDPQNLNDFFVPLQKVFNDVYSLRLTYEPYKRMDPKAPKSSTSLILGGSYVEKTFSYDIRGNYNRVVAFDSTLAHEGKDDKFDLTLEPQWSFGPLTDNPLSANPGISDTAHYIPMSENFQTAAGIYNPNKWGSAFRLDSSYTHGGFLASLKAQTFSRFFRVATGARQYVDFNLPPYRNNFRRGNNPDDPFDPAETVERLQLKQDFGHKVLTNVKSLVVEGLVEDKRFARDPSPNPLLGPFGGPRLDDGQHASRWNLQTLMDFTDSTHVELLHEEQRLLSPIFTEHQPVDALPILRPFKPPAGVLLPQEPVTIDRLNVDFKATKHTSIVGELELDEDRNVDAIGPDGQNWKEERSKITVNSQLNSKLFASGYFQTDHNAVQRNFEDGNHNIVRPLSLNIRRVRAPSRNGLDIDTLGGETNLSLFRNRLAFKTFLLRESANDKFNPLVNGVTDIAVGELDFNFTRALKARYQHGLENQGESAPYQSPFILNNFAEVLYTPSERTEVRLTYGYEYENPDDRFDKGPLLFYRTEKVLQLTAQTDF